MPISKYQQRELRKRNKEILALYRAGKSSIKIAEQYDLSRQGVLYAVESAEKDEKRELSTNDG